MAKILVKLVFFCKRGLGFLLFLEIIENQPLQQRIGSMDSPGRELERFFQQNGRLYALREKNWFKYAVGEREDLEEKQHQHSFFHNCGLRWSTLSKK